MAPADFICACFTHTSSFTKFLMFGYCVSYVLKSALIEGISMNLQMLDFTHPENLAQAYYILKF